MACIILAAIIILACLIKVITKQVKPVKYFLDELTLHLPAISGVIIGVNMVNFSRVLSLFLKERR